MLGVELYSYEHPALRGCGFAHVLLGCRTNLIELWSRREVPQDPQVRRADVSEPMGRSSTIVVSGLPALSTLRRVF
jgi:hypothetical protein